MLLHYSPSLQKQYLVSEMGTQICCNWGKEHYGILVTFPPDRGQYKASQACQLSTLALMCMAAFSILMKKNVVILLWLKCQASNCNWQKCVIQMQNFYKCFVFMVLQCSLFRSLWLSGDDYFRYYYMVVKNLLFWHLIHSWRQFTSSICPGWPQQ